MIGQVRSIFVGHYAYNNAEWRWEDWCEGVGRAHTVSFHMMVLDMMVVIGVPSMSHQRLQHVRERFVKPSPATVQYT